MRDPYDNTQTRFERTDRSGRWSPIVEQDDQHDPWWAHVIGGAALACLIAMGIAFSIGWGW